MALETPVWLQAGTYSARQDRQLIDAIFTEGVFDKATGGLAVTQKAGGTDDSVDVAAGVAVITGDDESNQGKYFVRNTATENVVFNPPPGSDERIDLLVLRVRDETAGGPIGDDALFAVIEGTVAGSAVAPSVPDTAIALAQVLRTAGDTSITNAMITDVRAEAGLRLSPPPAPFPVDTAGVADNDLLQYDSGDAEWKPVTVASLGFATTGDVVALTIALGG